MTIGKIHPIAFGVIAGILFSVSVFSMGLLAHFFLVDKPIILGVGTLYITYNPSLINAVFCTVIAGINGFIGGYIFSRIYNFLVETF